VARRPTDRESLATDPSVVLLPLRAFLGVTFLFAGLQKLANPNFFRAASPISIHAQLVAAGRTSPIKGILHHLVSVSTPLGLVIALAEVAIGLGVLAGVMTRVAAVGGMLLSFGLFLTVSFHSSPYYTGADIVVVFAFTPPLIAGAGRLTAAEGVRWLAQRYQARNLDVLAVDEERRRLIVDGSLAAVGLLLAGLAAGLGRLAGGTQPPRSGPNLSAGGPTTTTVPSSPSTTMSSRTTATTAPGGGPKGTKIGPASDVPVDGAALFKDPGSGDPGIVIQATAGHSWPSTPCARTPAARSATHRRRRSSSARATGRCSIPLPARSSRVRRPGGLRTIAISVGPDAQFYVT
jgi:thiosulfate dehydrogenase (quinone) large subunit